MNKRVNINIVINKEAMNAAQLERIRQLWGNPNNGTRILEELRKAITDTNVKITEKPRFVSCSPLLATGYGLSAQRAIYEAMRVDRMPDWVAGLPLHDQDYIHHFKFDDNPRNERETERPRVRGKSAVDSAKDDAAERVKQDAGITARGEIFDASMHAWPEIGSEWLNREDPTSRLKVMRANYPRESRNKGRIIWFSEETEAGTMQSPPQRYYSAEQFHNLYEAAPIVGADLRALLSDEDAAANAHIDANADEDYDDYNYQWPTLRTRVISQAYDAHAGNPLLSDVLVVEYIITAPGGTKRVCLKSEDREWEREVAFNNAKEFWFMFTSAPVKREWPAVGSRWAARKAISDYYKKGETVRVIANFDARTTDDRPCFRYTLLREPSPCATNDIVVGSVAAWHDLFKPAVAQVWPDLGTRWVQRGLPTSSLARPSKLIEYVEGAPGSVIERVATFQQEDDFSEFTAYLAYASQMYELFEPAPAVMPKAAPSLADVKPGTFWQRRDKPEHIIVVESTQQTAAGTRLYSFSKYRDFAFIGAADDKQIDARFLEMFEKIEPCQFWPAVGTYWIEREQPAHCVKLLSSEPCGDDGERVFTATQLCLNTGESINTGMLSISPDDWHRYYVQTTEADMYRWPVIGSRWFRPKYPDQVFVIQRVAGDTTDTRRKVKAYREDGGGFFNKEHTRASWHAEFRRVPYACGGYANEANYGGQPPDNMKPEAFYTGLKFSSAREAKIIAHRVSMRDLQRIVEVRLVRPALDALTEEMRKNAEITEQAAVSAKKLDDCMTVLELGVELDKRVPGWRDAVPRNQATAYMSTLELMKRAIRDLYFEREESQAMEQKALAELEESKQACMTVIAQRDKLRAEADLTRAEIARLKQREIACNLYVESANNATKKAEAELAGRGFKVTMPNGKSFVDPGETGELRISECTYQSQKPWVFNITKATLTLDPKQP